MRGKKTFVITILMIVLLLVLVSQSVTQGFDTPSATSTKRPTPGFTPTPQFDYLPMVFKNYEAGPTPTVRPTPFE